jgi:hypothetical protein
MNTATPTLEQMINMKLDERTNENKQMNNILSNIQKHGNYNKQDMEDLQDEEMQMYRMPNMDMDMPIDRQNMPSNMGMQNMPSNMPSNMGMQNMPSNMPSNMGMQNMPSNMGMQNMGMQNMPSNMGMQNIGMPMQNMGMPMQNMGMQNMPMQNMGMQNMYKKHEMYGMQETNNLDNIKTKKVISYIKNPLIVFIIFILLNSSIIIQTINNVFAFCNNTSLISIINLIVRGLLGSLLYIIVTNLLIHI